MTPELRHMLRDDDLNHEEQKQVLELAIKFHHDRFYKQPFAGPQAVAVLFDKPSTRTRSSFSIGVAELGGYPLVIDKSGSQLGRGEPVADTARVLDRMAYGVVWRTFGQDRVEEMAKYATCPVVNALTDEQRDLITRDFLVKSLTSDIGFDKTGKQLLMEFAALYHKEKYGVVKAQFDEEYTKRNDRLDERIAVAEAQEKAKTKAAKKEGKTGKSTKKMTKKAA